MIPYCAQVYDAPRGTVPGLCAIGRRFVCIIIPFVYRVLLYIGCCTVYIHARCDIKVPCSLHMEKCPVKRN